MADAAPGGWVPRRPLQPAPELASVFEDLGARVGIVREQREVTDYLVAAALVAAVAAAVGSLAWFSRLP